MQENEQKETRDDEVLVESRKRKREIFLIFGLGLLFVLLTFFEIKLFSTSEQLPFVHSIFFFGLVNFNIIILLLLLFFIFRNVVKVFAERQGKWIAQTLKAKLIAAFVVFSFVPTLLMFLISVFYINSSFDKWFSVKMGSVLRNSLEVTHEYYSTEKRRNYHFAEEILSNVPHFRFGKDRLEGELLLQQKKYSLDAIEYYPSVIGKRTIAIRESGVLPEIPPVSLEFLRKGLKSKLDSSTIHQFGEGNLVRVITPVDKSKGGGALVVSTYIPLSLISKMENVTAAYEEFKNTNPLEYPLKSIYLIILVLMTLVILFGATWFGFYLAKQLTNSFAALGKATRRVAQGDYRKVVLTTGNQEVQQLVENFNGMVVNLDRSKREVLQANKDLQETLERLDEHSRYIQEVLESVSTGVISVSPEGRVNVINRHAAQLLKINPKEFEGEMLAKLIDRAQFGLVKDLFDHMSKHGLSSLQKSLRIEVDSETLPIQMTISLMQDEKGEDIGKLLVFDDLTPVVKAQRAAAWTEVARRIAHEIKNPLTPIKLSAQRLQKKFAGQVADPAFEDCTRMIIQQTDEIKQLVNEFSNFARLPQTNPQLASLHEVIEETLTLYRSAHPNIQIEFEKDESLPKFKFDPEQIKRVVMNLVENSLAAMDGQNEAQLVLRTQFDNLLKIIRLTISDNGMGVEQSKLGQIFEPYYSTREKGTGLGLSIVKRIIEDHNGFIRALKNEPRGLKMIIELPVVDTELSISEAGQGEGLEDVRNG